MTGLASLGRPLRTIQGKMVAVFLLLTLLAMQLIGAYLLRSLQDYYLSDFQLQLQTHGSNVALAVAGELGSGATGDTLQRVVDAFGEGPLFSLLVVDRSGTVRGQLNERTQVGERSFNKDVARALAGGTPVSSGPQLDPLTHHPFMAYTAPVTNQGQEVGAVYVKGYLTQIYITLSGIRRVLFEATILALAVVALLSLVLARTITGPIHELTRRAGDLAAGRFDRLIEVRSGDELGRLAHVFNGMTVRLRDTLGEISSEKRKIEAILTNMADGIVAVGPDGQVALTNPAATRLLHVRPGQPPPPELGPLLEGGAPSGRVEVPERGLVLQAHVAPLNEGSVVVLQDVSEQERLEALRKEFVANVSHELRTPLTTIKSYVETLLDGALTEPEVGRRFLQVVADETNRMARLISDLLQLSQLDSRRAASERRPTDLAQLVSEVGERLMDRCQKKSIALSWSAPAGLPRAFADRDRIIQVLTNLLANAIDFTPSGGSVAISVGRDADRLEVRVEDSGVGIPARDLPRIFDRFYRVDKARSREFGGTGLGLAIAKEIVEAHDGSISIHSEVGRGTQVRFTLPIVPGDVA